MVSFGSGASGASNASEAAREAARAAASGFGRATPALAVAFASSSYDDLHAVRSTLAAELGGVPVVGGISASMVFGGACDAPRGVSVALLGGDDLRAVTRDAPVRSPTLVELVPVAEEIAAAADRARRDGFDHATCLVIAPSMPVDGEAVVAAVRKGVGAHAQLAGCLTGDDRMSTQRPPTVFAGDALRPDRVTITGLFTRRPIGVAARHGWRPAGPVRTVTRADGVDLRELDGRPALEVWLEDVRATGADPPAARGEAARYLTNHFLLGLADATGRAPIAGDPLVVRTPLEVRDDGASVHLSASVAEGAHVQIVAAARDKLLRASSDAAEAAAERAGGRVAGALVLACVSRIVALGDAFADEPAAIRRRVGAPIGGGAVYGEIARSARDVDAFFNSTTVVIAFPS